MTTEKETFKQMAPYTCKYCGMPSWIAPSDQSPPPDYCHESDHGTEEDRAVDVDDGWIEWKGGECPVDYETLVEVKFADGLTGQGVAGNLRWNWIFDGVNGGDIVAYRIKGEKGGAK